MKNKITLRPYQQKVLNDLKHISSIGLFMGTGSGKTITSLFRYKENPTSNLLVICPSSVVNQWRATVDTFKDELKPNVKVWFDKKMKTATQLNSFYVNVLDDVNKKYNNVIVVSLSKVKNIPILKDIVNDDWTVILDESHKIKELGTKRKPVQVTKVCLELAPLTDYKIILTATPTQKDKGGYIDYYTQLKFLGYMDMDINQFKATYCVEKKIQPPGSPFPIKIITGYKKAVKDIDDILQLTCRRYVPTFTDSEPQHIKVDLETPKNYRKIVKEKYFEELDLTNLPARRIAYKTLCSGTIMGTDIYKNRLTYHHNDIKKNWIKDFLTNTEETVVIFYNFNVEREIIKAVCKELGKRTIVLDGNNNHKYEDVQRDDYDVVIGQFKACGESIDGLQYKSHICVYYSTPESSLEYRQALGRINRDGQTKMPIYYYLVCEKTIESKIYDMISSKIEFSETILNNLCV